LTSTVAAARRAAAASAEGSIAGVGEGEAVAGVGEDEGDAVEAAAGRGDGVAAGSELTLTPHPAIAARARAPNTASGARARILIAVPPPHASGRRRSATRHARISSVALRFAATSGIPLPRRWLVYTFCSRRVGDRGHMGIYRAERDAPRLAWSDRELVTREVACRVGGRHCCRLAVQPLAAELAAE